jgi:hypothetical protein
VFTKQISLERWATIFENSVVVARHDTGAQLVTIAAHPVLRSLTAIQGTDNGVTLVSECALKPEFTHH